MLFLRANKTVWQNAIVFRGRSNRPEYWWFVLGSLLLILLAYAIDVFLTGKDLSEEDVSFWPFTQILGFLLIFPFASVTFRRLQDIGLPGWPSFIEAALSLATSVFLLVGTRAVPSFIDWTYTAVLLTLTAIALFPSQSGPNKYGPNPNEVPQ